MVDKESEEDVTDGKELVDEESEEEKTEEAVQEENSLEEAEDSKKLTIWEKILAFLKHLLYNILAWISNLIGGDKV